MRPHLVPSLTPIGLVLTLGCSTSESGPAQVPADTSPADTSPADTTTSDTSPADGSDDLDSLTDALVIDVSEGPDLPGDVTSAEDGGADAAPADDVEAPDASPPDDVPPPDPAAAPALPSEPIGAGLCVADVPRTGQTWAISALSELGARWVRLELIWAEIEPADGDFHAERVEERVGPYDAAGFQIIANLGYGTTWATTAEGADNFYPPDDLGRFAQYVGAVVGQVKDRVTRFEIWNEPNAGYRFWKPTVSGDPDAFGSLLTLATAAGHAACPECAFAFGAPFFHEQIIDGHVTFLTKAHAAHPGLAEHYDAMGFHPYPLYPPAAAPEGPPPDGELSFQTMAHSVRDVMAKDGPVRPLWATELGWPVFGQVTELRQAAYLTRAMLHLTALGVSPRCWFNLDDGPNFKEFPPEDAFGLYRYADPPTLKPAGKAFQLLGHRFAEHRITAPLAPPAVPDGVQGYVLEGPTGEVVWALWTYPAAGPVAVSLPSAASEAVSAVGDLVAGAAVAVELPTFFVLGP